MRKNILYNVFVYLLTYLFYVLIPVRHRLLIISSKLV